MWTPAGRKSVAATTQTYSIPAKSVWPFLGAAADAAGWKLKSQNSEAGLLTATTPASLRSWGNKVSIRVYLQPDGVTAVTVESKARAQLYTWGKTQEDLDRFFSALHRLIL